MNIIEINKITCNNEEERNKMIDILNKIGEKYIVPRSRDKETLLFVRRRFYILDTLEEELGTEINSTTSKVFEFDSTKEEDHMEELMFNLKAKFKSYYYAKEGSNKEIATMLVDFEPVSFL